MHVTKHCLDDAEAGVSWMRKMLKVWSAFSDSIILVVKRGVYNCHSSTTFSFDCLVGMIRTSSLLKSNILRKTLKPNTVKVREEANKTNVNNNNSTRRRL